MHMQPDFAALRDRMVDRQIAGRGVRDARVLAAMREVPREIFVPEDLRLHAYDDAPLPIGAGQTISQPFVVAAMIEAAALSPGARVLEIGAGSGYAAAVMSRIAREVYAIERHAELADLARKRIETLGYANVHIRIGDGTEGWPEAAPFDAIIASAGSPAVPDTLMHQLAIGAVLVIPVGRAPEQRLLKVRRCDANRFETEDLGAVAFVPLIGVHGWPEDSA